MKISIGIATGGMIRIETMMSLIYAMQEVRHQWTLNCHKGTYIHELRNNIITEARAEGADYVLMLDTDITFPNDAVKKLIDQKKDIIGGVYNMKQLPLVSTLKMKIGDELLHTTKWEMPKETFKCWALPGGFMLIRLEAIKDIQRPFEFEYTDEIGVTGEDVHFCKEAHNRGIDVWCDPTIKIGHIGDYVY